MSAITDVPGIRVGHAGDDDARTGCTVVLGPFRA
ncbi:MAG: peptidase S58 family protein, partial [Gemmatimonadetes bacterium]|nr:P1 family peptidase [Gemmatimonadota bacterium]NIU71353.1 P1 family peptidase [Actinomycetota bacterium]NIQ55987.1 P1 family peptidase [Gemmatimonadota bacterium]NIW33308.1 peptidase S58 family protein [Actinomycetota bacterium]NIX22327.1 peptidase S58 family protein [Actinomycetota bacterium]